MSCHLAGIQQTAITNDPGASDQKEFRSRTKSLNVDLLMCRVLLEPQIRGPVENVLSTTVSASLIARLYLHPAARDCQVRKLRCAAAKLWNKTSDSSALWKRCEMCTQRCTFLRFARNPDITWNYVPWHSILIVPVACLDLLSGFVKYTISQEWT